MPLKMNTEIVKSTTKKKTRKSRRRKDDPNKSYLSTYSILINSNKKVKEEIRESVEYNTREVWSQTWDEHAEEFVKIDSDPFPQMEVEDAILELNTMLSFELGRKYKRFHAHGKMTILHKHILIIDYKKLQEIFNSLLPVDSPFKDNFFMKIRYIPDEIFAYTAYSLKEDESESDDE